VPQSIVDRLETLALDVEIRTLSITACLHYDSNSPLCFIKNFAMTNDFRDQQLLSTSNTSVKVFA
jgi:hypothetical protein